MPDPARLSSDLAPQLGGNSATKAFAAAISVRQMRSRLAFYSTFPLERKVFSVHPYNW